MRHRAGLLAIGVAVGTLLLVGVVLGQGPTPTTTATTVAVRAPAQAATPSPSDFQRLVYVALAEQAATYVLDFAQPGAGMSVAPVATRPAGVGATPQPASPIAPAMPAPSGLEGADLITNMRSVLHVSEKALSDMDAALVAGALAPGANCPNLVDHVAAADDALRDIQRLSRRTPTGPLAADARLLSALSQAVFNLRSDIVCLTGGAAGPGPIGIAPGPATVVGTPALPAVVATGVAPLTVPTIGTPALPAVVATGVAPLTVPTIVGTPGAVGTPALPAVVATGVAPLTVPTAVGTPGAVGTPPLPPAVVATGVAPLTAPGAGTPAAAPAGGTPALPAVVATGVAPLGGTPTAAARAPAPAATATPSGSGPLDALMRALQELQNRLRQLFPTPTPSR